MEDCILHVDNIKKDVMKVFRCPGWALMTLRGNMFYRDKDSQKICGKDCICMCT